MSKKESKKKKQPFVPPVFLVSFVLRLRRFLLRSADAVVPSHMALYDRFMGAAMTSLVHSAASLRIADILVDGPLYAAQIAERTGTSVDILERTLRVLVSINVFRRLPDGRFANNGVSSGLITGSEGGIRGFSEFFGKKPILDAWNNLPVTLNDGVTAFSSVHGKSVWDWLSSDEVALSAFVEGMSSMTEVVAPAIAAAYPFEEVKSVCDVGGGVGIVLAAALNRHPHLNGVLFDSQSMLNEAKPHLASWGITNRVKLVPGNFFESVPKGVDAYIIKTVLHNWDDNNALNILRNCRAAMEPGQRILVVDFFDEADSISTLVPFMDLAGMLIFSGKERNRKSMESLFNEAGFRFSRLVPLPACQAIYEGIAVEQSIPQHQVTVKSHSA
ncbi:MAG TPA: methyltransferase [Candidatus Methanoperedens sp.]